MPRIETFILRPSALELSTCAKWRVEAFGDVLNASVEAEEKSLQAFTSDQNGQVALVAKLDGVLAGTCLLARSELEPCHPVSPWLAGLYVAPEHRRRGVGRVLVAAIEDQAGKGAIAVSIYIQIAPSNITNGWVGAPSIRSTGEGLRQH